MLFAYHWRCSSIHNECKEVCHSQDAGIGQLKCLDTQVHIAFVRTVGIIMYTLVLKTVPNIVSLGFPQVYSFNCSPYTFSV